ncbi:FCD domain-containing protein [Orrella sp. JC864]|uniref:FadR/GntR family transcriptional regulator n=1 Tax=Orrella sp. JC864 TaxID=3120298 RepID=UPI00300A1AB5
MRTPVQTLTDRVAGTLAARIAAGEYPLASKLPAGRLLAAEFGVSAAVIREATERLRAQGLIESRQGAGCVVRSRTAASGFRVPEAQGLGRAELAALYELRIDLESATAAWAALRRTTAQADGLARILEQLEQHLHHPDEGARHDLAFHAAIAAATHNPYYQGLIGYLTVQLSQAVAAARRNTASQAGPQAAAAVHREHVAIYEAIRAGEPEQARAAASRHLRAARARLGLEGPAPGAQPHPSGLAGAWLVLSSNERTHEQ